MIVGDTLQLALRNLGQAKLRTSLTTLGVAIGIASLTGMVSLGVGLQDQFVSRFTQSGVFDSITVLQGSDRNPFAALGGRGGIRAARRGGEPAGRVGGTVQVAPEPAAPANAAPAATAKHPALDDDAVAALEKIPDVKLVYPNMRVSVEVRTEQFNQWTQAAGIPLSSQNEGAFQNISYGTFFKNDTDNTCLLSLDFAKGINADDPKSLVGKQLTIGYFIRKAPATAAPANAPGSTAPPTITPDQAAAAQRLSGINGINLGGLGAMATAMQMERKELPFTVVGIVEREPSAGPLGGLGISGLMLPLGRVKAIDAEAASVSAQGLQRPTDAKKAYNSLTVKVTRAAATEDVEDKIKAQGFNAFSINDALKGAKRAFIILDIVLSLIGSIALAVSSLGIVNTMVMSILERTREIGVMKAIGGTDSDIRNIFLVEASAIGILGGISGVALGWLVGRIINFGANMYIVNQGGTAANLFSIPLWLVLSSIGFSWLVSLIAGSYPASRAAKLDPIHALRHD